MALHKKLGLLAVFFCSLSCARTLSASIEETDFQSISYWEQEYKDPTENSGYSSQDSDFSDDQNWDSDGYYPNGDLASVLQRLGTGTQQTLAALDKLEKENENNKVACDLIRTVKKNHKNTLKFVSSFLEQNLGQK